MKRWIILLLSSDMSVDNYGSVWWIDQCLPVASFNILKENVLMKYFNWVNLRPMYSGENNSERPKVDRYLYLLQEIKATCFLKINVHEVQF